MSPHLNSNHPKVDMAHGDNDKKAMPSLEKEQFDAEDREIQRKTEEFNAWLDSMEAMDEQELRGYAKQNKATFCSQNKAAIKKLMQKDRPKKKRKKTTLSPILGAVLKFHKDDDVDPPEVAAP